MHPSSFGCVSRRRPPDRDPEERQRRLELVSGGHLNAPPLPSVDPDRLTCGVPVLTVFPSPPLRRDQRKRESEGKICKNNPPDRAGFVQIMRRPSRSAGTATRAPFE